MNFEWDDAKRRSNIAKHQVDFTEATAVFSDPHMLIVRLNRRDQDEDRMLAVGAHEARVLAIIYTVRAPIVRIISARRASRRERRRYYASPL